VPDGLIAAAPGTDRDKVLPNRSAISYNFLSWLRPARFRSKPLPNQAPTSRQRSESRSTTFPRSILRRRS